MSRTKRCARKRCTKNNNAITLDSAPMNTNTDSDMNGQTAPQPLQPTNSLSTIHNSTSTPTRSQKSQPKQNKNEYGPSTRARTVRRRRAAIEATLAIQQRLLGKKARADGKTNSNGSGSGDGSGMPISKSRRDRKRRKKMAAKLDLDVDTAMTAQLVSSSSCSSFPSTSTATVSAKQNDTDIETFDMTGLAITMREVLGIAMDTDTATGIGNNQLPLTTTATGIVQHKSQKQVKNTKEAKNKPRYRVGRTERSERWRVMKEEKLKMRKEEGEEIRQRQQQIQMQIQQQRQEDTEMRGDQSGEGDNEDCGTVSPGEAAQPEMEMGMGMGMGMGMEVDGDCDYYDNGGKSHSPGCVVA